MEYLLLEVPVSVDDEALDGMLRGFFNDKQSRGSINMVAIKPTNKDKIEIYTVSTKQ